MTHREASPKTGCHRHLSYHDSGQHDSFLTMTVGNIWQQTWPLARRCVIEQQVQGLAVTDTFLIMTVGNMTVNLSVALKVRHRTARSRTGCHRHLSCHDSRQHDSELDRCLKDASARSEVKDWLSLTPLLLWQTCPVRGGPGDTYMTWHLVVRGEASRV